MRGESRPVEEKKYAGASKDTPRSFVIIHGKRIEGINAETDEIVSGGKVYNIYNYNTEPKATIWNCPICDAENDLKNEKCCVCGKETRAVCESSNQQNKNQKKHSQKKNASRWLKIVACLLVITGIIGGTGAFFFFKDYVYINGNALKIAEITKIDTKDVVGDELTQDGLSKIERLIKLKEITLTSSGAQELDISNLAELKNLESLTIDCPIQNQDLSVVSQLPNLKVLNVEISMDNPKGISGENLQSVQFSHVGLTSLSGFGKMPSLQEAILSDNRIKDITPLKNYTSLKKLDLSQNKISDVSALASLSNLEALYLSKNDLTQAQALGQLTNLTELTMLSNPIVDSSFLQKLTKLENLEIDTTIADLQTLQALPNLKKLVMPSETLNGKQQVEQYVQTLVENEEKRVEYTQQAEELITLFNKNKYSELFKRSEAINDKIWSNDMTGFVYVSGDVAYEGTSAYTNLLEQTNENVLWVTTEGIYYGSIKDMKRVGSGIQIVGSSWTNYLRYYSGAWEDNYPNGYGTYYDMWDNSPVYLSGNFINGQMDGRIKLVEYKRGHKSTGYFNVSKGTAQDLGEGANGTRKFAQMDDGTYWQTPKRGLGQFFVLGFSS